MKTTLFAALALGSGWVICPADAQQTAPAPTPLAVAPAGAASLAVSAAVIPSQTIFAARLPTPVELTSAAAAQGLTIERIEQSGVQVVVVYRFPDGQTKAIGYQLLPVANASVAPTVVVETVPAPAPAPTVVYYEPAPRVIYYDSGYYPYSYSRAYYPPVSLSFGFGFHGGGGGYYRGGHHGHW